MEKIDFAIRTLKEMSLNTKHQKTGWNIESSNIILEIVCNEVEKWKKKK